jgi:hypothetical protein
MTLLAALAGVIDEGRGESARVEECAPLTAEGLVGASVSILYTRLLKRERKPLADLLGELVAMIVAPYLGAAAARRERTRPAPAVPVASRELSGVESRAVSAASVLQDIPMRLTYRTVRVLEAIAAHPGASNRGVAERHRPGAGLEAAGAPGAPRAVAEHGRGAHEG